MQMKELQASGDMSFMAKGEKKCLLDDQTVRKVEFVHQDKGIIND